MNIQRAGGDEAVLCPALCLMYAFFGLRLAVYGRVLMILELEEKMWRAAQARDKAAFLELVDVNAVMVCGGTRCTGAEYAEIIADFD